MSEDEQKGKSISIGDAANAFIKNWKAISLFLMIIGMAVGWGYTLSDVGNKHREVVSEQERIKSRLMIVEESSRANRELLIEIKTIVQRMERNRP